MTGLQIGRIGGIPLAVPPLFFIWSVFLWWSLAMAFPRSHMGFPQETYRAMAVGATLLTVASILIHELCSIAVCRILGGRLPDRVLLAPCGGWLHGSPGSTEPAAIRAEILAAFCGPAVYMALAVACLLGSAALQPAVPNFLPTRAVLDTLAIANSSLAVLNLLPGMPLDAGRVVSAIVRRATGDADRADRIGRFGGVVIGLWLCALAVAGLAAFNPFWSLWSMWGVILGVAVLEGALTPGPRHAPVGS